MRKALRDLKRFILAKNTDDERHEIRSYVAENGDELPALADAVNTIEDDAKLVGHLLAEIASVGRMLRERRVDERARAAQAAADVLASAVRWRDDTALVDIGSLLMSTLTNRADLLVFTCEAFTVAVFMAPLLDLARLKKAGMTAFVDARGLHVRWRTGGLNLRPQTERRASRIVITLPERSAAAA